MVGCTNELNSILPFTTFSLDSAEAGAAEQEGTTVFHFSSPPKIFIHEVGLQRELLFFFFLMQQVKCNFLF